MRPLPFINKKVRALRVDRRARRSEKRAVQEADVIVEEGSHQECRLRCGL